MEMRKPDWETPEEETKRLKKVAAATIVGSMLEWYDFYLYATMASIVFSKIFFDSSDPSSASMKAFSTFAIGFLARPIGGILFGYFGDRFGRKKMLYVTFLLMGVCTTAIGLIPSYAVIGFWAPMLLVVIRVIQGLGAGAELAGAAVTSYEHASDQKRGRQGAWPALGLNLGLLLSSLTIYLLTLGGDKFLLDGGWRIPFLFSSVLVMVGLWVRKQLPETPEFNQVEESSAPKKPFKELFGTNLKGLSVVFFVAIGYNALSYISRPSRWRISPSSSTSPRTSRRCRSRSQAWLPSSPSRRSAGCATNSAARTCWSSAASCRHCSPTRSWRCWTPAKTR